MKQYTSIFLLIYCLPLFLMAQSFQWADKMGGGDNDANGLSSANATWKIYPNPTTGTLYLDLGGMGEALTVQVQNTLGQVTQSILRDHPAATRHSRSQAPVGCISSSCRPPKEVAVISK